jgi:undecaprenyl pyrophosphate phosphatase UppP
MNELLLWMAVNIIAEALPISSSTHVSLLELVYKRYGCIDFLQEVPLYFSDFFYMPILVLLLVFFFKRFKMLFLCLVRKPILFFQVFVHASVAIMLTVITYVLIHSSSLYTLYTLPRVVGIIGTGMLLYSLVWCGRSYRTMSMSTAFAIGLAQSIALAVPGISRFASTYVVGRWCRLSPRHSFEFSWLIHAPLMFASVVRSGIIIMKLPNVCKLLNAQFWFTMLIAMVVAGGALYAMQYLAYRHKLYIVALYMLVPLAVYLWLA